MDRPLKVDRRGNVALVTMVAPPVNALDARMRAALVQVFGDLGSDAGVAAILLAAEGAAFSAGLDLRDAGPTFAKPDPGLVCRKVAELAKPVIALVHAPALAFGAELALAAHYRLAAPGAALGFPERSLGLIPVAGAAQRLTRLAGVGPTLDLLLDGRPVGAAQALSLGLLDEVVPGDLVAAGLAYADRLVTSGAPPRRLEADRSRLTDGAAAMRAIAAQRARLGAEGPFAARAAIDCVEAALTMPFAVALAHDRARYEDCLAQPEAAALRHLVLAERRISPHLLARDGAERRLTPAGQAVADRLRAALTRAGTALVAAGTTPEAVDTALAAWGMADGVFGGAPKPGRVDARVERPLIAAMMAEGARALAEGQVECAADIDVIAVRALGLGRGKGGPMHWAERHGLASLAEQMRGLQAWDAVWAVPAAVTAAVADGGRFPAA